VWTRISLKSKVGHYSFGRERNNCLLVGWQNETKIGISGTGGLPDVDVDIVVPRLLMLNSPASPRVIFVHCGYH